MNRRKIVLVADDIRSCHNIGSLMRTAEGLGVEKLYLCGNTPYPEIENDSRPPHIRQKVSRQINKTALGSEKSLHWSFEPKIGTVLAKLRQNGYVSAALEQAVGSVSLPNYRPPAKIALVLGNEISGVSQHALASVDITLSIPMLGQKESLNVTVAAAIALYHLRYSNSVGQA